MRTPGGMSPGSGIGHPVASPMNCLSSIPMRPQEVSMVVDITGRVGVRTWVLAKVKVLRSPATGTYIPGAAFP